MTIFIAAVNMIENKLETQSASFGFFISTLFSKNWRQQLISFLVNVVPIVEFYETKVDLFCLSWDGIQKTGRNTIFI
jgi:hypothetical protein